MNAFVLEALARLGGASRPVVSLVTSDEEIASPASRPTIEAAARGARAVFNAEPGRPSGNIVSGRKGAMFLSIEVTGKPAHSGSAHDQGVSAIEELCRKVIELHALTDYASGTTVNVGLIEGGQSINTVAPRAGAKVDVRFKTMAAMAEAEAAIETDPRPGPSPRYEHANHRQGRLPAARADRREPGAVRALRRLRGRARPDHRRRVHRRLGGLRLHRGGRGAHRVRHRPDRRDGAQPGRGLPPRQPRPARPGPGPRDPAPRLRNAVVAAAMAVARRRPPPGPLDDLPRCLPISMLGSACAERRVGQVAGGADQLFGRAAERSGGRGVGGDSAPLRALRLLHRDLPDLRAARRRARQPARAHLPDQGHAGERQAGQRRRSSSTSTAACPASPA